MSHKYWAGSTWLLRGSISTRAWFYASANMFSISPSLWRKQSGRNGIVLDSLLSRKDSNLLATSIENTLCTLVRDKIHRIYRLWLEDILNRLADSIRFVGQA